MKLILVLNILTGLLNGVFSGIPLNPHWGGCPLNTFPCGAGVCLPYGVKCNDVTDCADGSDEYQCALPLLCAEGHIVFNLDNGLNLIISSHQSYSVNDNNLTVFMGGQYFNLISCGSQPTIANGLATLDGADSSFGATANVTCDEGYESCKQKITCLPSGTWESAHCSPTFDFACYTCDGSNSNEDCNSNLELCPPDRMSCGTIVKWLGNTCEIRKGCINPVTGSQNLGCRGVAGGQIICKYNCDEAHCNELIPATCASCGNHEDDGPCTRRISRRSPAMALRGSNCRNYCHCTRENGDFRWIIKECPPKTLFDASVPKPACRKRRKVTCHGVDENACSMRHGVCSEEMFVDDPRRPLPNTDCERYCVCEIKNATPQGVPIFTWTEKRCQNNKLFSVSMKKCQKKWKVQCDN